MVKYSREPNNPTKSAKAMGRDLRVHFKPCGIMGEISESKLIARYSASALRLRISASMRSSPRT